MTDRTDGDHLNDPSDGSSDSVPDEPPAGPAGSDSDDNPSGLLEWFQWFRTTDRVSVIYLRDILTSVMIVLAIGAVLFTVSGVWPPMVAVESGSMEPNMERGDLIFLIDNERFTPDEAVVVGGASTGVVPADVAESTDRTKFGSHGDVIVFRPNGNAGQIPIIHRAMFFVEEDEDWYDRADPAAVGGADDCSELHHCPAPHAGFITKGDNQRTNANYDQASRLSAPVRPGWIVGTAELRVPYLGHVRLLFSTVTVPSVETVEAASDGGYHSNPALTPDSTTLNQSSEMAIEPAQASPSPA